MSNPAAAACGLTPQRALNALRILWWTLLIGISLTAAAILSLVSQGPQFVDASPWMTDAAFYAVMGFLLVDVITGHTLRMQHYKQGWKADRVTPGAYFAGNVLLFACLAAAIAASLATVLTLGSIWPLILPGLIGLAVLVLNYPHGKPMRSPAA